MAGYIVSVASTVTAAGMLAGVGYLRGISRRLRVLEDKTFAAELHALDHEKRIKTLELGSVIT